MPKTSADEDRNGCIGASPEHRGDAPTWADVNCHAVLEASPDALLVVNRAGEILAANLQAGRLFGFSREQLIGRAVESLLPVRFRDRHRQHRERFLANPEPQFMQVPGLFGVRCDTSEFPADVNLSRMIVGSETFAISAIRDATEQLRMEELKRSEAVLRESEEHFRLLADTAPVLIWQSGKDKLCTYFNKPWLDFTGRSIEEELGDGWTEGVHPEDFQKCLDIYTQSFDRREQFRMEYRLRRHDGQHRWITDIGVPRFNQDGSFAGYIGIGVDINDRKLAEDQLREYEKAVEAAEEMIAVVDREYRILLANRKYATMRNMVKEEILGRFVHEVVNREVFEGVVKPKLGECFQGKVVRYEMKYTFPELGERDIAVSYFPIEGATGVEGAACIFLDITEHKQAEEALRESEEKFRSVYRDAGVGMVIVSPEGRFLAANPTFCDYLGYTEEELLAKTVESVTLTEDWAAFAQKLREVLTQERGFQWFQKRCLHKTGRIVYTETSCSVIRSREGNPQYLVGQVLDITKRKEAEEALSEMTRKLIEAQEQERARIGRELHDDINQRLAMLAVELEQLNENPSEVESRVQELRRQTAEISNDVQALSHDLHSSQLDYLGVVAGMKSWCKEFGNRRKMEIDCRHDVPSTLPTEIGLCLFRVLQESLHNAAKHSGVKRIEVQLHEESGEVHLIIRDLGRGFDIEAARKGRGLGLTSMRERVRLVNGTISIESKPMGGTTIHVRVPFGSDRLSERAVG